MSFQSLNHLLLKLQQQPAWENYQQHLTVMRAWEKEVEPDLLAQTKPLGIRNHILWVATSTPVLSQTLTLQRFPLLKRLNSYFASPLRDIRYSTVQWHQFQPRKNKERTAIAARPLSESALEIFQQEETTPPKTPLEAFQRWTNLVETQRSQFPVCPVCLVPTRPQELERWSMCGTCISRTWKNP